MKYIGVLFCFAVGLAITEAFAISGGAGIDGTGASAGASVLFPRIPGLNAPFGRPPGPPSGILSSRAPSLLSLFDLPDPRSLIPDSFGPGRVPNVGSSIAGLLGLSQPSSLPGVSAASQQAREHITENLLLGSNFTTAIQQAIQNALNSTDPTTALRNLVQTILTSYVTAAANCPLIIIGARVLQEGIRLALEVAQSAQNIILGTNTTVAANSTTT